MDLFGRLARHLRCSTFVIHLLFVRFDFGETRLLDFCLRGKRSLRGRCLDCGCFDGGGFGSFGGRRFCGSSYVSGFPPTDRTFGASCRLRGHRLRGCFDGRGSAASARSAWRRSRRFLHASAFLPLPARAHARDLVVG
jgi:hypothetical protein